MNLKDFFQPIETKELFGHEENFNFIKKLYLKGNLPKVLLISGEKGIGKFTLINHFIHFYFDRKNYDEKIHLFSEKSNFHKLVLKSIFPNLIYFSGGQFNKIKIEDIRNLKILLSKSTINNDKRFIILDDVETFNANSLNALLKIIEEPNTNNYFILINNRSKSILETIKSRCLEINIFIDKDSKRKIIHSLIKYFNQNILIKEDLIPISPGFFLRFNHIINEKGLNMDDNYLLNCSKILNFYKKEKNILYRDFLFFLNEYYLFEKNSKKLLSNQKLIEYRFFLNEKINDFFSYNLNQSTLLTQIQNKF